VSTKGILFIATGERYVNQAKQSAQQIKSIFPEISMTLVSDAKTPPDVFNTTKQVKDPYYSNRDKVENIPRTEYDQTIFLDTDTYVATEDALPSIFEVLDWFDVAVASDPYNRGNQFYESDELPSIQPPHALNWFNTGVIGFNSNTTVKQAFSYWQELYAQYSDDQHLPFDQIPFHQVIYETDVRYGLLPPEYNFVLKAPQPITEEIRILHAIENIENSEELVSKINTEIASTERNSALPPRWMFSPVHVGDRTELLFHPHHQLEQRIKQLRLSVQQRGLYATIRSLIKYIQGGGFYSE
jgi:hypothetical protein